jgi:hypothetical protein
MDVDPVFCEIAIRRVEHFRASGKTGWQNSNPFAAEIKEDAELRRLVLAESREDDNSRIASDSAALLRQPTLFR